MVKFKSDKKILTDLKKSHVLRYPFNKSVTSIDEKINVLIQVRTNPL